jgi:hypothetical protein
VPDIATALLAYFPFDGNAEESALDSTFDVRSFVLRAPSSNVSFAHTRPKKPRRGGGAGSSSLAKSM